MCTVRRMHQKVYLKKINMLIDRLYAVQMFYVSVRMCVYILRGERGY